MKELEVRIEDAVFLDLTEFYKFSLKKHPALDEATVLKKEQRLIQSLKALGKYALTDHRAWSSICFICCFAEATLRL